MISNRFRDRYRSGGPGLMILAHRGDSFRAPENTLEAARLGHAAGADGWELDVRSTLDGVPVVIHDESLARTTDVARRFAGDPRTARSFPVEEFTLDEVRSLDAGSWFLDPSGPARSAAAFGSVGRIAEADLRRYASGTVRVPTLAEALEWTVGVDWLVNVEIKATTGDPEALVRAVLGAIRASGATGCVAVSSFDHAVVSRVAALEPGVATGALVDGPVARPVDEWLRALGADALHASWGSILAEGAAPAGFRPGRSRYDDAPLLAYTVNLPGPEGPAARLAEAGASGLFTDDPASFRAGPALSRS